MRTQFGCLAGLRLLVGLLLVGLVAGGCPLDLTPPSGGQVAQGTGNVPPTIWFTRPQARSVIQVGAQLLLGWVDEDPDDNASIRLEYDFDGLPHTGDEVLIVEGIAEDPDGGDDTYRWDTAGVPPGVYRVAATIDDGVNPPVTKYLDWEVVIRANESPTFRFLNPLADVTDPSNGQLTIRWTDFDAEENAKIDIFYDVDGVADSGDETFILQDRDEDPDGAADEVVWDLAAVAAGTYFIGATIDDGVNPPVTVYADGRLILNGPSITLVRPALDVSFFAGESVLIEWEDADPSHSADISLYYDVDLIPDNGNEQLIVVLPEDADGAGSDDYGWQIPNTVTPGDYYLLGVISNGVDPDMFSYAPGKLTVKGPRLDLLQPASDVTVRIGDVVQIEWADVDPFANATITVFADLDGTPNTGDEITIVTTTEDADGAGDRFAWTVPPLTPGTYWIGAVLDDGINPAVSAYAPGRVIVPAGSFTPQDVASVVNDPTGDDEFAAIVFQGFSAGGRLGQVLAGGEQFYSGQPIQSDSDADGISDFVMVATQGFSLLLGGERFGEAYLVYGFGSRPPNQKVLVSSIASGLWPGAIFPGVTFDTRSDGITSAIFLPDVDGDGFMDLLFGLPWVVGLNHEDQDYDPIDDSNLDRDGDGNAPDDYMELPYLQPNPSTDQDPDWHGRPGSGPATFNTGLVVFATTSHSGNGFLNQVIPLGDIGQVTSESEPAAVQGNGMRIYPTDLLANPGGVNLDRYGQSVAVADLDNDGIQEWYVAAPMANSQTGMIQVIFAATYGGGFETGNPTINNPDADVTALSWPYVEGYDSTGDGNNDERRMVVPFFSLSILGDTTDASGGQLDKPIVVGDFNGDGRDDLACVAAAASPGGASGAGAAYIIFGHATFGNFDLGLIDNTASSLPGLELLGANAGDGLGTSHARFGDLDGDGYDEWAIGLPGYDFDGRTDCGAVLIVFGGSSVNGSHSLDEVGDPASGKPVPGLLVIGAHAGDQLGQYVASAGDADGDGRLDIVVAAPGYDGLGRTDNGAVYLIYGGPSFVPSDTPLDLASVADVNISGKLYVGPNDGDQIGILAPAGDVDNDGRSDFLIGNPNADPRGVVDAGEVYLIFGGPRG